MYLGHKIMWLEHRITCLKCLRYRNRVMCLKYLGNELPFHSCRMFIFRNMNVFTHERVHVNGRSAYDRNHELNRGGGL